MSALPEPCSCTISPRRDRAVASQIQKDANSPGTKNNVTGNVGATESGPGGTASASLDVIGTPVLMSASSRKTHGSAGTFDLALTFVAPPAINHNPTTEPRLGPTQTIVMTFDKPIQSAGSPTITEGTASFGGMSISGNDVILNFTGVTDMQYVTFSIANVMSTDGGIGGVGSVRVGFLSGNVTQTRKVLPSDVAVVRVHLLEPVGPWNFVYNVTLTGHLLPSDASYVKSVQLNGLGTP